ncbi:hypothetical protein [Mannheimia varigena]|uniref:PepSY domain-containing protein n=1 Tax=Mannheimia varigena USDA-ARS-USMARC-1296 TaxID=1433287 RepID=W0QBS1_9PAST|nr:hypothetical protein [Mannheimia varigena]AHG75275.1 hypothetical protein X808_7520 [Mannheimia varigena USDA-ARS-USMARC-1296]AHG77401.1 hypothetical protein X874_7650 [Mannheimia varigena USDA-ARS-USMARC-1312]AHG79930.1 hypothetical protein X875_13120 [Mannheimia varigena USDA-ARS-USMARC-1388]MDY2947527.1 hypothetical protein [Mannheimia varigena]QLB16107.1 hypothetical protein A6B40_00180 [Mannheimia varigena]
MKNVSKTLLVLTTFASVTAFAQSVAVPEEIYQPQGELIKSELDGKNEFEVEYHVKGTDVRGLAEKAIEHAKSKGFDLVKSEIKDKDADLKFKRNKQELDIDIELEGKDRIEYKADFDLGNK